MTILLFGFEPYLEYKENPSQITVQSLNGRKIAGQEIKGVILPVDYASLENLVLSTIDRVKPRIAIGLGLAPGRNKITPEKIAVNYKYASEPDNEGKIFRGEKIDQDQPDGLFTNLPVEALVDELNNHGIPASLSFSAGAYLCNNAMFLIVRESKRSGFRGGFIHVPCHTEYISREKKDLPSLPLETIQKGIEVAMDVTVAATLSCL